VPFRLSRLIDLGLVPKTKGVRANPYYVWVINYLKREDVNEAIPKGAGQTVIVSSTYLTVYNLLKVYAFKGPYSKIYVAWTLGSLSASRGFFLKVKLYLEWKAILDRKSVPKPNTVLVEAYNGGLYGCFLY